MRHQQNVEHVTWVPPNRETPVKFLRLKLQILHVSVDEDKALLSDERAVLRLEVHDRALFGARPRTEMPDAMREFVEGTLDAHNVQAAV
jgi:hypothetical protein